MTCRFLRLIFPSVAAVCAALSGNIEVKMNQQSRLLRTREAARFCGFAKSTLEKLRCTGGGPNFIRRGRAIYYQIGDLEGWMDAMPRYRSTSEADAAKDGAVP